MKKNKKKLKGFTLIELIIVLALFSVIMTLVLSFIDPLSRLMTKTSIKERTSSYADNIGTYVDKSIRYSQFVRIFENDFCTDSVSEADTILFEEQAVQDFADDFFDGIITSDGSPLKGQIHVMKLINTPVDFEYKDGSKQKLEAGRIYETVYNFTANDSKPKRDSEGNKVWIGGQNMVSVAGTRDQMVLNDEHFMDYCYFYSLGLYNFKPITRFTNDEGNSIYKIPGGGITEDPSAKTYYSRLVPRTMSPESTVLNPGLLDKNEAMENINASNLVVNIIAYQNGNRVDVDYNTGAEGETDVPMSIFQSPASMESIGMTLRNITGAADATSYYYIDQEDDGTNKPLKPGSSSYLLLPVTTSSFASAPFTFYRCTSSNTQNLYFIYTIPSETADSEIKRNGVATPDSGSSSEDDEPGPTPPLVPN